MGNRYFDYIEDLIERENVFTMEEFSKSVNEFLAFRRYDILKDWQRKFNFFSGLCDYDTITENSVL